MPQPNAKKVVFIFFLLAASISKLFAYEIDMSADRLMYDQHSGIVHAGGNAEFIWQGKVLKADNVQFDVNEKKLYAEGNVSLAEAGSVMVAESITYDYEREKGDINSSLGYSNSMFFRSEQMVRQSSATYSIHNVTISNCDLDHPHVSFQAHEGTIILEDKITINNAIMYIGSVPVFYLPRYSKSIKPGKSAKRLSVEVYPGYTNEGGLSAMSVVKYSLTDELVLKGLVDYYGTRGWGFGGQVDYDTANTKASVYGYRIRDEFAGIERWTFRPSWWQRFNDKWLLQSQAEFISDTDFNNIYDAGNWDRVVNSLHSYFALTRQSSASNLLILAERYDTDLTGEGFEPTQVTFPKVQFSLYPRKTLFGLVRNFAFNYEHRYNTYDYNRDYYHNVGTADFHISKDYKLSRKFTLKPTVGIAEEWTDSISRDDDTSRFNTDYYGALNGRYRVTSFMDWNLNYTARLKSKSNSLAVDDERPDYGFATNRLAFDNYISLYSLANTTIRNYIQYDFRNLRNAASRASRWSPFVTEIMSIPSSKVMIYLRQEQNVEPSKFNSLQMDTKFGYLEKTYLNLGVYYQDYYPDNIDFVVGLGMWLNAKWRLDYLIRFKHSLNKMYSYTDDQEIRIYRDMHCYNLGVSARFRGEYHDVFVKFDLKTNMPFAGQSTTDDINQEFYPWR